MILRYVGNECGEDAVIYHSCIHLEGIPLNVIASIRVVENGLLYAH